jgi:hypothetical protein
MLWEIAKNHNATILIVSNKERTANALMLQIIAHIERNERYKIWAKAIDPSRKGVIPKKRIIIRRKERWGKKAITIDRSSLQLKDPTIGAAGRRGMVLSRRTNIIIAYKLVDQKNAAVRKRRQKMKSWVHTILLPVLVPGGRFIYWGRSFHKGDFVSESLSSKFFDYRQPWISEDDKKLNPPHPQKVASVKGETDPGLAALRSDAAQRGAIWNPPEPQKKSSHLKNEEKPFKKLTF